MTRFAYAALALACAVLVNVLWHLSPTTFLLVMKGFVATAFLVTVAFVLIGALGRGLAALIVFVCAMSIALPALADVATGTAPIVVVPSGVTVPYGQWIVDYGPAVASYAITALAGIASWAIAKWAPWASSIATQQRLEMAARALAQYAINAVPDSVKDGKVTVHMGPTVLETAVQRGVNVLPSRVLKAAEKGGGLASIVFRVLDLEDGGDERNVLKPAMNSLRAAGIKA